MEFLGKNTRLALYTSVCAPVHFVLDRTSGKTQSDIYLEISTIGDAERFAQRKSGKSLGARSVNVELVSSKEMLNATFPRVRDGQWLTREEIQNLLTHAKTFKSPYTRKCPQRPFENYISILALFPWANKAVYAQTQVDLLYSGYASMVSILQWHIRKGKITSLDTALLRRLIIAGTNLTDFSSEQKKLVCSSVGFYPESALPQVPVDIASTTNQVIKALPMCSPAAQIIDCCIPLPARSVGAIPKIEISEYYSSDPLDDVRHSGVKALDSAKSCLKGTAPCAADLTKSLLKLQTASQQSYQTRGLPRPFAGTLPPKMPLSEPCLKNKSVTESKLCPREQWLLNARKAGIAVGVPAESLAHPR